MLYFYENTIENAERNKVINITAKQGDAALLNNEIFQKQITYQVVLGIVIQNIFKSC